MCVHCAFSARDKMLNSSRMRDLRNIVGGRWLKVAQMKYHLPSRFTNNIVSRREQRDKQRAFITCRCHHVISVERCSSSHKTLGKRHQCGFERYSHRYPRTFTSSEAVEDAHEKTFISQPLANMDVLTLLMKSLLVCSTVRAPQTRVCMSRMHVPSVSANNAKRGFARTQVYWSARSSLNLVLWAQHCRGGTEASKDK